MILESAAFRDQQIVEAILFVDVRSFGVCFCMAVPDDPLFDHMPAGFDVDLKLTNGAARVGEYAALNVDFAIIVEEKTRIEAIVIKIDRLTPVVRPDVGCGDVEVTHLLNAVTADVRADDIENAVMVSYRRCIEASHSDQ